MLVLAIAMLNTGSGATAQDFTTYKGHGGPIMGLDVAPSGVLASASFDNSVGLWSQGVQGTPQWFEGHDAAATTVSFDLAPVVLSGGDDFRVLLWTPGQPEPLELTKHLGKVADIAVSPDGTQIVSASWDGFIQITPNPTHPGAAPHAQLSGHASNVTAVGFSPDAVLYSASSDGTLRVWEETQSGLAPRALVKHGFGINEMVVTADWIAYGAVDGATRVIDRQGQQIADFTLDRRPVLAMDYHAATGQLAVGDGHGYIMMIDTTRWRIARDFRAMRRGPVWALAFSPDGAVIHAGGIDDVIYAWPVGFLDRYDPVGGDTRSFLRDAASMPNGERQFMRKCSICHALTDGPSRKAGPSLYGIFGRQAGVWPGYRYSPTLDGSAIIWTPETIDALFDQGPDHYIPGSKMPMQVIAKPSDRADLIAYLQDATAPVAETED